MINGNELKALTGELAHVCSALMNGERVWLLDPVDGWVITRMVNPARSASDYHVGECAPE